MGALYIRPIAITTDEVDASSISDTSDDYSGTAFYTTSSDPVNYGGQTWQSLTGTQATLYATHLGYEGIFAGPLDAYEINDRVAFGGGGTLPTGLNNTTLYYIVAKAQTVQGWPYFKVSTTESGSPVNLTGFGSGERLVFFKPNVGNTPAADSEHWSSAGPTNKMAPFDLSNATQAEAASPITYTITPGAAFDAIGFLNLTNVETVQIVVSNGSAAYDETYDLTDTGFGGSETFYFSRLGVSDLPGDADASIALTFTGTGTLGIGGIVPGLQVDIGETTLGPNIGIDNYSVWARDLFGTIERTERGFSDRGDFNLFMTKERGESMLAFLTGRRAEYGLFFMNDDADFPGGWRPSGIIYGFVKSFQLMLEYHEQCMFSVEIEGVT